MAIEMHRTNAKSSKTEESDNYKWLTSDIDREVSHTENLISKIKTSANQKSVV